MNEPIVSIIVPVYKVEQYLDKCIKSLLNQTYSDYEIILVDDGSPDDCPQMCDAYAANYEKIRVIHKKNEGLSSARNIGVLNARGQWIVFVDSDDFVEPDYISYMWKLKEKYHADLIVCGVTDELEDGTKVGHNGNLNEEILNAQEAFFSIYFGRNGCHQAYSKLIPKSVAVDNLFPEGYFEDYATTYKWLNDSKRIVMGDGSENYHYIQRDGSILNSKLNKKHLHGFEICDQIAEYILRYYPEYEKKIYLLYQKQVIQIINKQMLSEKQLRNIFYMYRYKFRKNAMRNIFEHRIGLKTRLYTLLLCTNPQIYNLVRHRLIK